MRRSRKVNLIHSLPFVNGRSIAFFAIAVLATVWVIAAAQSSSSVTILFVGDMMFDRSVRTTMDEKGDDFVFSCSAALLQSSDVTVGNLEGPITSAPSKSVGSAVGGPNNFTFTFDPAVARQLYRHNVRIVNIGNNHILNFGTDGVAETKEYLSKSHVDYFGAVAGKDTTVLSKEIHGVKVAFINYNQFGDPGGAAQALIQIRRARADGYLPIVYTHWGEEYQQKSSRYTQALAHLFVDAGAEIVVGSHPHVVQESEVYKGKTIYYSLGNFIFDQYWDEHVSRGLTISVTLTEKGVTAIQEIPVQLGRDRRTCPDTNEV